MAAPPLRTPQIEELPAWIVLPFLRRSYITTLTAAVAAAKGIAADRYPHQHWLQTVAERLGSSSPAPPHCGDYSDSLPVVNTSWKLGMLAC